MNNLPPGCSTSDLPGNRPEDQEWDDMLDRIVDEVTDLEELRTWLDSRQALSPREFAVMARALGIGKEDTIGRNHYVAELWGQAHGVCESLVQRGFMRVSDTDPRYFHVTQTGKLAVNRYLPGGVDVANSGL